MRVVPPALLAASAYPPQVSLVRRISGSSNGSSKIPPMLDPSVEPFEVIDHKTFHRYVVRAKAGGKQSSKDGKFHSAGSQLRAYNEQALERDIQELLFTWARHLTEAQLVFVSAPSSNSKAIFGLSSSSSSPSSGNLISSSDLRVRRVPFITQRPTFSELKRVARLLASVFEIPAVLITDQEQRLLKAKEAEQAASGRALSCVATRVFFIAEARCSFVHMLLMGFQISHIFLIK